MNSPKPILLCPQLERSGVQALLNIVLLYKGRLIVLEIHFLRVQLIQAIHVV